MKVRVRAVTWGLRVRREGAAFIWSCSASHQDQIVRSSAYSAARAARVPVTSSAAAACGGDPCVQPPRFLVGDDDLVCAQTGQHGRGAAHREAEC